MDNVLVNQVGGALAMLFAGIVCAIVLWLGVISTKAQMEEKRFKRAEQMSPKVRFEKFIQEHPKLKDKTTINRLKTFIKQRYAIHKIIKELYRLYLLDCDAVGKTPLCYRKWKFAYGL